MGNGRKRHAITTEDHPKTKKDKPSVSISVSQSSTDLSELSDILSSYLSSDSSSISSNITPPITAPFPVPYAPRPLTIILKSDVWLKAASKIYSHPEIILVKIFEKSAQNGIITSPGIAQFHIIQRILY